MFSYAMTQSYQSDTKCHCLRHTTFKPNESGGIKEGHIHLTGKPAQFRDKYCK